MHQSQAVLGKVIVRGLSVEQVPGVSSDAIEKDIALRTARHKLGILELKNSSERLFPPVIGRPNANLELTFSRPLCLLALGDSWFDYPLLNNGPVLQETDIIAQLKHYGTNPPRILNLAHYGDASTDAMSLEKRRRLIAALADSGNWIGGKPDGILFSAGGNDVAGIQFKTFLNDNNGTNGGLNLKDFQNALRAVEQSYRTLFKLRDTHAPKVPIYSHTYGNAIPNGVHPSCAGPWLQPSLAARGWTSLDDGTRIVKEMLRYFHDMLAKLQGEKSNRFVVIESHKIIEAKDWANELHPTYLGFRKVVKQFHDAFKASHLQS